MRLIKTHVPGFGHRGTRQGFGEFAPTVAVVGDDVVAGFEDPVREQFWRMNCQAFSTGFSSGRSRRQRQEGDVVGDHEPGGDVPPRLVEDERGVRAGIDGGA